MNLNEYQTRARATRLPTADATYAQLNLSGEVGELLSVIAKARRKQADPDRTMILKEAGDVLWQLSAVCDDFGLSLNEVAQHNLEKLSDRAIRGVIEGSGDHR
jgi:NTP pyrophosphatase (non-canonical NTP hydrolase)